MQSLASRSAGSMANTGPAHAFLLPYDLQFSMPSDDLMWPRRASLSYSSDGRYLAAAAGSGAIYDTERRKVVWRYGVRSRKRDDAVADMVLMKGGHRAFIATKKSIFIIDGDW